MIDTFVYRHEVVTSEMLRLGARQFATEKRRERKPERRLKNSNRVAVEKSY